MLGDEYNGESSDIDVRASALSVAVRTDGGGLGGRSTTYLTYLIVLGTIAATSSAGDAMCAFTTLEPPARSPSRSVHVLMAEFVSRARAGHR